MLGYSVRLTKYLFERYVHEYEVDWIVFFYQHVRTTVASQQWSLLMNVSMRFQNPNIEFTVLQNSAFLGKSSQLHYCENALITIHITESRMIHENQGGS